MSERKPDLAERIADDLFQICEGVQAHSLRMVDAEGKGLGGYSHAAMVRILRDFLSELKPTRKKKE